MDNSAGSAPDGNGAGPVDRPAGGRRRHILLLAGLAFAVVVADLITKIIAVATLTPGVSPHILGGLVYFSLYRNAGAAFSMATGMTWILTLVVIGVVAMIIRMATRLRSTAWAICLGLVLGGAVGNLIDRLFRSPGFLRGHVVDFISVFGPDAKYFAIFNVADSAITCGGIALVFTALLGVDFDGRKVRSSRASRTGSAVGGSAVGGSAVGGSVVGGSVVGGSAVGGSPVGGSDGAGLAAPDAAAEPIGDRPKGYRPIGDDDARPTRG